MSEITDILTGAVILKRETSFILDRSAAAASLSPSRQPGQEIRLEIDVDGCTVSSGLVNVYKTAGPTEQFSFSQNGTKGGYVDFTAIDGITTSGISGGFISIRAVNKIGQTVNQIILVSASVPVRFFNENGRIVMKRAGQELIADYKIMAEPDLDIRENDLVYPLSGIPGLTFGQVNFVEKLYGFDGTTHHTECGIIDL